MILIGALAVFKPALMSEKFGIPTTGSGLSFVVSTGIRDLALGLVVLVLYAEQVWWMLVWTHLFIAVVAISDFAVVLKSGNKKIALVHMTGAIALVVFSAVASRFL